MILALTNFGHRFYKSHFSKEAINEIGNALLQLLKPIYENDYVELESVGNYQMLIKEGFVEEIKADEIQNLKLKYKRNPLEHIEQVVFEFTTECNFNCRHCRNGFMPKITETNIELLKKVADKFKIMGINNFSLIGGEVSKFGNGWLELTNHINPLNNKIVSIYTNGWWLEQKNFEAAGKKYDDDIEYVKDLKENGVTHILFSIDGSEQIHDHTRRQKGLYKRIVRSFGWIKEAGVFPRISAIIGNNLNKETTKSFVNIADRIYDLPNIHPIFKLKQLQMDRTNTFSSMIDIGNNAKTHSSRKIDSIKISDLRCKAYFRPWPNIRIMANGNLSVCPLLDAGEGFGNIHDEDIVSILNNMHNSFVYQLHAERKISNYLKYLDKEIFGEYYNHVCSIRAILTILARKIEAEDNPSPKRFKEINYEIAKYAGFT